MCGSDREGSSGNLGGEGFKGRRKFLKALFVWSRYKTDSLSLSLTVSLSLSLSFSFSLKVQGGTFGFDWDLPGRPLELPGPHLGPGLARLALLKEVAPSRYTTQHMTDKACEAI